MAVEKDFFLLNCFEEGKNLNVDVPIATQNSGSPGYWISEKKSSHIRA